MSNENVSGALAIDASTGELTVSDVSAFDFETNPSITATYKASNGTEEATANITITVNDVTESTAFITTWETTTANESITIPTRATLYTYNYTVDWGDGNTDTGLTGDATHTYTNAETYEVKITGTFPAIHFFSMPTSNNEKVKSIEQWGDIQWQSMLGAFNRCINLELKATDLPDLSNVTEMSVMFSGATNFTSNSSINNWDMSNITKMDGMFEDASSFNQNIDSWDVSNVIDMGAMFRRASSFNQSINSWNVGNVTNMGSMFEGNTGFNQNIASWNVSNVTRMGFMFGNASAFNQNLSGWSVANVTNCNAFSSGSGLTSGNLPNFTNCTP